MADRTRPESIIERDPGEVGRPKRRQPADVHTDPVKSEQTVGSGERAFHPGMPEPNEVPAGQGDEPSRAYRVAGPPRAAGGSGDAEPPGPHVDPGPVSLEALEEAATRLAPVPGDKQRELAVDRTAQIPHSPKRRR
jgi:hypothetical protein